MTSGLRALTARQLNTNCPQELFSAPTAYQEFTKALNPGNQIKQPYLPLVAASAEPVCQYLLNPM